MGTSLTLIGEYSVIECFSPGYVCSSSLSLCTLGEPQPGDYSSASLSDYYGKLVQQRRGRAGRYWRSPFPELQVDAKPFQIENQPSFEKHSDYSLSLIGRLLGWLWKRIGG